MKSLRKLSGFGAFVCILSLMLTFAATARDLTADENKQAGIYLLCPEGSQTACSQAKAAYREAFEADPEKAGEMYDVLDLLQATMDGKAIASIARKDGTMMTGLAWELEAGTVKVTGEHLKPLTFTVNGDKLTGEYSTYIRAFTPEEMDDMGTDG